MIARINISLIQSWKPKIKNVYNDVYWWVSDSTEFHSEGLYWYWFLVQLEYEGQTKYLELVGSANTAEEIPIQLESEVREFIDEIMDDSKNQ